MKRERLFIICFMLLTITASLAQVSKACENYSVLNIIAKKDNVSSEPVSVQKIPCNWEGWQNSFPEVRCGGRSCSRQIQVLKMRCIDGVLTEVKAGRICVACMKPDSPGL